MPAEHDVDDDVVLRRSWPALYDDVVRRGTRLRRRRRHGDLRRRGDGSDLRRLSPDVRHRDGAPALSPDGAWIAFQSERDNPLRGVRTLTDVYVMRPDGSGVRRVTTTAATDLGNGDGHPAWSPDSMWLVADEAGDVSRIVVLRPDGSGADGRWIAFRRRPADTEELWVVRPDGTEARRVVAAVHDGPVAWTPDGTRLTYAAELPDGRTRLVTVRVDGSRSEQVSVGPGVDDLEPAWSAGGELVVYSADPDGEYLVQRDVGEPATSTGGRQPGRLVLAVPGREVVRTLTSPEDGDHDRGPSLAPTGD